MVHRILQLIFFRNVYHLNMQIQITHSHVIDLIQSYEDAITTHLAIGCHDTIVSFHKDLSPSGEQVEHLKLAHEL